MSSTGWCDKMLRQVLVSISILSVCGLVSACIPQVDEDKKQAQMPSDDMGELIVLDADADTLDEGTAADDLGRQRMDGSMSLDAGSMDMGVDMGSDADIGQIEEEDMFARDLDWGDGADAEMTPPIEPEDPALEGPGRFVAVGWRETLVSFDSAGMLLGERHLVDAEQYNKSLLLRTTTYGPDGFVALGDKLIYWSTDGESWTASTKPDASPWIAGVDHGNGRYVGAGYNGAVWSADGRTWGSASIRRDLVIRGLTFGAGKFVAVGEKGAVATSLDGESWEVVREPVDGEPGLSSVAHGQGKFVAVGASGVRLVSVDGGVTWGERELWPEPERTMSVDSNLSLTGVIFARGQWLVVGRKYVYTSADATAGSWVRQPPQKYFTGVTYGGGEYVATAGREAWSSTDGITWSKKLSAYGSSYWGIAFKPDMP